MKSIPTEDKLMVALALGCSLEFAVVVAPRAAVMYFGEEPASQAHHTQRDFAGGSTTPPVGHRPGTPKGTMEALDDLDWD